MNIGSVIHILRTSIFQILIIASPVLIVGMLVGLTISILQATTSIQEQTLTFVPKIAAIFITIAVLGPWMFAQLSKFTIQIFNQISGVVK